MFKMSRAGSGRVRKCSNSHGSGRVYRFSNLAGRVKSYSNLTGRVGSGQDFFKFHWTSQVSGQDIIKSSRVGSGHDPRETGHSRVWPA